MCNVFLYNTYKDLPQDVFCAFRLNSSDQDGEPMYIQMVTALVLQLIQCVVLLPNERDIYDEYDSKVEEKVDTRATKSIYSYTPRHRFLTPPCFLGGSRCLNNQFIRDSNEDSTKLPLSLPQKVITLSLYSAKKLCYVLWIQSSKNVKLHPVTWSIN